MNDVHLHLIVNHFPIIGIIFGIFILIFGIFLKNKTVLNTAYILFVVSSVFGYISMFTGEGAEEIVEELPNINHNLIHKHEEFAEQFTLILYVLAVSSLIGLVSNFKNNLISKFISIISLMVVILAIYYAVQTGISGGEIIHTEIRK